METPPIGKIEFEGNDPFYRPAGAPIKPSTVSSPPVSPSLRKPLLPPLSHATFLEFFSMLDGQADAAGQPQPAVTAITLHYAPNIEPEVTAMFKHMPDGRPAQTKTWPLFAVEVRYQQQPNYKDGQWLLEVNERNV